MKLYSRIQGKGADLISMHGLFGSCENLSMVNRLLADFFCVHAVDLRNHGRSENSPNMDYTHMAKDIVEYMNHHNIETANLVGHSMGGKVAMKVALNIPNRIKKIAVLDIAPITYTTHRHENIFLGLNAINLQNILNRQEADKQLSTFIEESSTRQFLLKSLYKDESKHFKWRYNLPILEKCYEKILSGLFSDEPYEGEIIFLKGEHSDYLLPEYKNKIITLFPKSLFRVILNADHWLHVQKPNLIASILIRFLIKKPPLKAV